MVTFVVVVIAGQVLAFIGWAEYFVGGFNMLL